MSALRRKSSVALLTGIVVMLLLIPIWYMMLAPSIMISELEKIDLTTSFEGTFGKKGYIGTATIINRSGVWEIPITVTANIYATEVKGENVTLNIDATMIRNDTGETLPAPFSINSTYVFDKFTMENVKDHPDADKPRKGYDPLYPSHRKAGEDIPNVWLDMLNATAEDLNTTLKFVRTIEEEGVELYEYFVNATMTKTLWIEEFEKWHNCTLTSTKTILVEPLSGLLAYTKEETFDWIINRKDAKTLPLVYIKYKSTAKAKADGLSTAKTAHDGLQLLELYIPTILGVVATILIIGLAFNLRRPKRKMAEAKTKPPASRR